MGEEDGIYLQKTVKDENKISYVTQSKERLKDIINDGFRVVSDNDDAILMFSNSHYYFVPKSLDIVKRYEIVPVFNVDEVSKIISNKFFLISGNWYYASYVSEAGAYHYKIPELTENLEIIADFNRGAVLLKDDNAVYVLDERNDKLEKISHLSPSQTHFIQTLDFYSHNHYLYDDDTFYLTDIRFTHKDITKQFNMQGKHNGFTKAEIHISHSGDSIDTKDGLIWLRENSDFTPVQATYLNAYKDLYVYRDKVYADNWNLLHQLNPLDLSLVQNPNELHQPLLSVFSDNKLEYSIDNSLTQYNEHPLKLVKKGPASQRTKDYIEIKKKRIFIDGQQLNTDLFKDKPIFLGSIVNIINQCDGDDGRIPVVVDYYYFFTDGKKVYAYINPKDNNTPKVLDNVAPQNLKVNDYDTLQKLLNMFKTTAKENDKF